MKLAESVYKSHFHMADFSFVYLKTEFKFFTSLLQVSYKFYVLSLLLDSNFEAKEYILLSQFCDW